MNRKPLTEEEKQKRREQYAEQIKNPELKKALANARRAWHQANYQRIKDDPILWAKRLETTQKWRKENPDKTSVATIRSRLRNPEKWLWNQARKRSLDKGLEFTLLVSDIIIPDTCPIMGKKLEYIPKGFHEYSPSIDRIDSSKGYTKDNIQVISSIANRMKWNATREQLITFCKGVLTREEGSSAC